MSDFLERIRLKQYKIHEETALEIIRSGQLAVGPHTQQLEQVLRERFKKQNVILTTNGFSALLLTLSAVKDLRSIEKVFTTAAGTCFAMVNSIKAAGLNVEFSDLDDMSAGINNEVFKKDNALIIAPDHFGRISSGLRTEKSEKTFVIEDAAQSFFSREQVDTSADVVTLSFYPTKWINGIDGGAILLDDDELACLIRKRASYVDQIEYEHRGRYNAQMSNLHAAIALSSLQLSEKISSGLKRNHELLVENLSSLDIEVMPLLKDEVPSRFIVKANSIDQRDRLIKELKLFGIGASTELFFLCPVHTNCEFPDANELISNSFSLPFYPWLESYEIEKISDAMVKACSY